MIRKVQKVTTRSEFCNVIYNLTNTTKDQPRIIKGCYYLGQGPPPAPGYPPPLAKFPYYYPLFGKKFIILLHKYPFNTPYATLIDFKLGITYVNSLTPSEYQNISAFTRWNNIYLRPLILTSSNFIKNKKYLKQVSRKLESKPKELSNLEREIILWILVMM